MTVFVELSPGDALHRSAEPIGAGLADSAFFAVDQPLRPAFFDLIIDGPCIPAERACAAIDHLSGAKP